MTLSRKIAQLIVTKNLSIDEVKNVLTKYKLLGLLPAIKERVGEYANSEKSSNTLSVESPFPLTDDTLKHIKGLVGEGDVPSEVIINKNILAGFKARYKGKLYDGSAERIIRQFIK